MVSADNLTVNSKSSYRTRVADKKYPEKRGCIIGLYGRSDPLVFFAVLMFGEPLFRLTPMPVKSRAFTYLPVSSLTSIPEHGSVRV